MTRGGGAAASCADTLHRSSLRGRFAPEAIPKTANTNSTVVLGIAFPRRHQAARSGRAQASCHSASWQRRKLGYSPLVNSLYASVAAASTWPKAAKSCSGPKSPPAPEPENNTATSARAADTAAVSHTAALPSSPKAFLNALTNGTPTAPGRQK